MRGLWIRAESRRIDAALLSPNSGGLPPNQGRHRVSNSVMGPVESRPLTEVEASRLVSECRRLPKAKGGYAGNDFPSYGDYMTNVFLTVLDLQMHNVVVNKAILHYRANRWATFVRSKS
jgi:hypothetical protein